jgi:hypothetical protein
MTELEYLKRHHAISETTLGSVSLLLMRSKPEDAHNEIDKGINKLNDLCEHYRVNSTWYMTKALIDSGDWKKDGSLFRSHKLGVRNLKEAFDIVQAKNNPPAVEE